MSALDSQIESTSAVRPNLGLAAIANADAKVLVLGSLPGAQSIQSQRYYAHPQNGFWRIMAAVLNWSSEWETQWNYDRRCLALKAAGVALWDVYASARRIGSLDSAIDKKSAQPNDFSTFFQKHPGIRRIVCNGGLAASAYQKGLAALAPLGSQMFVLPSSSPAHAGLSLEAKILLWREAFTRPLILMEKSGADGLR